MKEIDKTPTIVNGYLMTLFKQYDPHMCFIELGHAFVSEHISDWMDTYTREKTQFNSSYVIKIIFGSCIGADR